MTEYKILDYASKEEYVFDLSVNDKTVEDIENDIRKTILSYKYNAVVHNEALAQALLLLTEEERSILLMHWFLHMADREIALQLKIARRTVNDRRRKSYYKLVRLMKGETNA